MVDLPQSFAPHLSSYQRINDFEYEFYLINYPGSPWILRIKAEKDKRYRGYYGVCSLKIRTKDQEFFSPSMYAAEPEKCIVQTLGRFLLEEPDEICKDDGYKNYMKN